MVKFLTKKKEINVFVIYLTKKEYQPIKVIKHLASNEVVHLDESDEEVFRDGDETQAKDIRETPNSEKVMQ